MNENGIHIDCVSRRMSTADLIYSGFTADLIYSGFKKELPRRITDISWMSLMNNVVRFTGNNHHRELHYADPHGCL